VSVSATRGASGELVAVALGYAAGSAVVLLLIAYGGRRLLDRLRAAGRGPAVQRVLGVVMVATAVAVATDLDVRFQTALANDFPSFVINPTRSLERSGAVEDRLADLRGSARFAESADGGGERQAGLPVLGTAPDFTGNQRWFNTPGDAPLDLHQLRGRVVLVDFWTYTCINCLRTLPYVRAWDARYRSSGLTIVGVHTPEFPFERDLDNVREAARDMHVDYPIVIDNGYAIWGAFSNRYWPALYFVDAEGTTRHHHFGEGEYESSELVLQELLTEAGARDVPSDVAPVVGDGVEAAADWGAIRSPETYLGMGAPRDRASEDLRLNDWALSGDWSVAHQAAMLTGAEGRIAYRFQARDLHLVMGPAERGATVPFRVLVDGQAPDGDHGVDVDEDGSGEVTQKRLHQLIRQRGPVREGTFEIIFLAPGVEAYAFTFG
jgi:thiol-disulfide isomerase/thioredoxin